MLEKEPTENLIVASGFSSSERILEEQAGKEQEAMRKEEERLEKERFGVVKQESGQSFPKGILLDPSPKQKIDTSVLAPAGISQEISSLSKDVSPITEQEPKVEEISESRISKLASNLGSSLGRASTSFALKTKGTRQKTKRALKAGSTQALIEARRSAKATKAKVKTGTKLAKGATFIAGSRLEQRIFDKPKVQRAIFRPLESRERRLLGLPADEPFTSKDLRLLALGVAPASLIRQRQLQINEINNQLGQFQTQVIRAEAVRNELANVRILIGDMVRSGQTDGLNEARALRDRLEQEETAIIQAEQVITQLLEQRSLLQKNLVEGNIPVSIRQQAFRAALENSPTFRPTPVGTLQVASRPRGRPRKRQQQIIEAPQVNVIP